MIYSFLSTSNVLIKYDLKVCKAYVTSCSADDAVRYISSLKSDCLTRDCKYSEILYKERVLTRYGIAGTLKAIKKIHIGARKFGEFSEAQGCSFDQQLDVLELREEKIKIIKNIISVFDNTGTTDWKFEGVGRGALRIYPSNGAIHSFRPEIVMGKYIFNYFPFAKVLSVKIAEHEALESYLYVVCELGRVLEKYSDMAAIVALYIELGHIVSVLLFYSGIPVGSLKLTRLQEGDHQTVIFARLTI